MIQLKDYQEKAVKELKEKILDMLQLSRERQKIVFKAPTGAGKTVMASALLDQLNIELSTNYQDVAFIWIAPRALHVQSYLSMRNFFSESRTLRPVMFEDVDAANGLESGDILFLNWESINKDNAVLIRDNEQNRTLHALVRSTKQNSIPIVVVVDEEHMYVKGNLTKSEKVLDNIRGKVELRISATPVTVGCPLIDVPRERVIAEEMIKKGIELNPFVTSSNDQEQSLDIQLLELALKRRDQLARAYREFNINPLLLIQLPDDNKNSLETNEKKLIDEIVSYLDVNKGITVENERLAIWLSDRKENVANIQKKDSITDVLLFKQAIALGWDCPRASVLLIFRHLQSEEFTIQTVGRILRMPELHHYTNDSLNYGYVYTDLSADKIKVVKDDMSYLTKVAAKQRNGLGNISLPSVFQEYRKVPHVLMSPFKRIFKDVVMHEWKLPQTELFGADDGWDNLNTNTNNDAVVIDFNISENRRKASAHGIRIDVDKIQVVVPRNVKLTGEEQTIILDDKARFCRTMNELTQTFNDYCRKNVGNFEPGQSAEMIRSAIFEFFEEFLGKNEYQAIKCVLYHLNRPKFAALLKKAEDRYERDIYAEEEKKRNASEYHPFTWSLPEIRIYNSEVSHACDTEIFRHALVPFFEENSVSGPESIFSRFVDKENQHVDWWYKNGDKGKMHFAIPYTDNSGNPRSFYVDYIIRLKNGTVCLFDTKTKGSDPEAPNKHNALLRYMEEQNEKGMHLVGGVCIQNPMNEFWYYSPLPIETTDDITGWDIIDFHALNS